MNKKTINAGITGNIGAGKSLVCKIFFMMGVPVYDADSRAKSLMKNHPVLKDSIVKQFGEEAYTKEGEINRGYLASKIYNQAEAREKLNGLVHPVVAEDYKNWCELNVEKGYRLTIKEAALLIETDSYKNLDALILVTAPDELKIKRTLLRDSFRSKEEVEKILSSQMPDILKAKAANYVVINDDKNLLLPQILEIYHKLVN
ncbi:MAG: dephospho-CoA kinase [Cyclobacteriaceae bacterium]|nr:dephospho-CoA kinase [Cyclobacteriaceae bacterium]